MVLMQLGAKKKITTTSGNCRDTENSLSQGEGFCLPHPASSVLKPTT